MTKPQPKRDEDTNLPYCDPQDCPRRKSWGALGFDFGTMWCMENEWTHSLIQYKQLCEPQLELDQKRLMEIEAKEK